MLKKLLLSISFVLAVLICTHALEAATAIGTNSFISSIRHPKVHTAIQKQINDRVEKEFHVWVLFTDKDIFNEDSFRGAMRCYEEAMPKRTRLRRRMRAKHKTVDFSDLPVFQKYVDEVLKLGAKHRATSRWLNAISVSASSDVISKMAKLPYVRAIDPVAGGRRVPTPPQPYDEGSQYYKAPPRLPRQGGLNYGGSAAQIQQINVDKLHNMGYHGEGVVVGVLDMGFDLSHEAFQHLDVIAEHDFIHDDDITANEPGQDVDPQQDHHGTAVLSVIAGYRPGELIGPAFAARYLLAKTEEYSFEKPIEEDWCVEGIEWLEHQGADVITTSLYFDDWYQVQDMDGKTTKFTLAADMAVDKGVVFTSAAGNAGAFPPDDPFFKRITPPADGFKVIAVGAVDANGVVAWFSSRGPTADGRIKPDVMARGTTGTVMARPISSSYYETSWWGTSLSTPLVAGTTALLLQAFPTATPADITLALKSTASNADSPNNDYGWGIVNAEAAYEFLVETIAKSETVPPAAINDLSIADKKPGSITLTWTAPGDDGNSGTATRYHIRYSTLPINEGNFGDAERLPYAPSPQTAGTLENLEITGFSSDVTYYIAIKTEDDEHNMSEISNVLTTTTPKGVFTDVAGTVAISGNGTGISFGDYDGNGDLDIFAANESADSVLYRNDGDGKFNDVTDTAELDTRACGAVFGDYNNDGYPDIYIAKSYGGRLCRNDRNGTFVRKGSTESGISPKGKGTSISFGDYDNDGDLDIYLAASEQYTILYSNIGHGIFTDVTKEANVRTYGVSCSTFFDYDNDGDLDIYLLRSTRNRLYKNNGDGAFEDVTEEAGVKGSGGGKAISVGDYDNDGYLDIYVVNERTPNILYRNNGDGTFSDATSSVNLEYIESEWTDASFLDYDNDGYLDIYVANASGPDVLYGNNGDRTFTDVTVDTGVGDREGTDGIAVGDYNGDGYVDILAISDGINGISLYQNVGSNDNWLHIKTVGTKSNRDGIGARVKVTAGTLSMIREISGGSGLSQNSLIAGFGLGKNTQADIVEIRWTSGQVSTLNNVAANQLLVVNEPGERTEYSIDPSDKLLTTFGKIKQTALLQNYPNPFNPETWIPFQLSEATDVTVIIYNVQGQLIQRLELGHKTAGSYISKDKASYWDGKNDRGEEVSSGVYFYNIKAGDFTAIRKMLLLK